jgi:RNAse (barnase) inhibitor barstar
MYVASIKLYHFFRKNLSLPETAAQELVEALDEVIKDQITGKIEHTMEIVHKDIQSLKDYMDNRFATKDALARLDVKIESTKSELVRWMFLFWIGQLAATFGFILFFLKK